MSTKDKPEEIASTHPAETEVTGAIQSVKVEDPLGKALSEKEDYYQRLVRVSADFDNYRKRHMKEKQEWLKYGPESFIKAFLPTMDNLERAMNQCPSDPAFDSMRQGLRMVLDQMNRNLQADGVTFIDPKGEPFDPLLHEALTAKVDASVAPGTIIQVHHKGYKLWDRLLRAALVTVAAAPNVADETPREGEDTKEIES
jgi:molecular chaperone GrpE